MQTELPIISTIQKFEITLRSGESKAVYLQFLGDPSNQEKCSMCNHPFANGLWMGNIKMANGNLSIKRCPRCENLYT
ncbi:MAG: hypothetical protein WC819_04350 [Parcubacteria group bacterium]